MARTTNSAAEGSRAPAAHVALLRGINVGGKNKLAMSDLVALFVELGCSEVKTYIQSGNVVFRAPARVALRVPDRVAQRIRERFGLEVGLLVRTAEELDVVAQSNPYLAAGADSKALHVLFLRDEPAGQSVAALDPDRSPPDSFVVRGREVYLCCPNGFARTKLTNDYFDRRLGTMSTCRNWQTVLKLQELAKK